MAMYVCGLCAYVRMQAGSQKKRAGLTHEGSDDETVQTERRRAPQPQQRGGAYNKPRIIEEEDDGLDERGRMSNRKVLVQRKNERNKPYTPRLETYDSYQKGALSSMLGKIISYL